MRYSAIFLAFLATIGCSKKSDSPVVATDNQPVTSVAETTESAWGGLRIQSSGAAFDEANQIVVLLHGYGATETDLVPLAEYIGGDSRSFVFPAAPVSLGGGGLAWATTEQELEAARSAIGSLVRFASRTYPNAEIAIGGFSQGATISTMLLSDPSLPIRHLLLYSPALMIDAASINPATNIRVLLAHGQGDSVLPFEDSKRLNEMLVRKRVATNWNPFDGGHTITTEILDATRDQLNQTDR